MLGLFTVSMAVPVAPAASVSEVGLIVPAGANCDTFGVPLDRAAGADVRSASSLTVKNTAVHVPAGGFATWMSSKSASPCGSEYPA